MEEKIPKSLVKDEDIDLADVVQEATDDAIKQRKTELSKSVRQLFYKADQLAQDIKKRTRANEKDQKKLDRTLEQIKRLKAGDWDVIKELNQQEKEEK